MDSKTSDTTILQTLGWLLGATVLLLGVCAAIIGAFSWMLLPFWLIYISYAWLLSIGIL